MFWHCHVFQVFSNKDEYCVMSKAGLTVTLLRARLVSVAGHKRLVSFHSPALTAGADARANRAALVTRAGDQRHCKISLKFTGSAQACRHLIRAFLKTCNDYDSS